MARPCVVYRGLLVATLGVVVGCSNSNGGADTDGHRDGAAGMTATSGAGGTAGEATAGGGGTGAGGSGGSSAGGGGQAGAAISCMAYTSGGGCLCSSGHSGGLAACSPDSVKMGDNGFCCGDSLLCSCFRIACVSLPNIKTCDCGVPQDSSGDRVDSCTKPSDGVCCLQTNHGQPARCHCNGYNATCSGAETEVASCSLADVKDCGQDSPPIDLCK